MQTQVDSPAKSKTLNPTQVGALTQVGTPKSKVTTTKNMANTQIDTPPKTHVDAAPKTLNPTQFLSPGKSEVSKIQQNRTVLPTTSMANTQVSQVQTSSISEARTQMSQARTLRPALSDDRTHVSEARTMQPQANAEDKKCMTQVNFLSAYTIFLKGHS